MRTGASASISYSEIDALYRPQLKSAVSRLASVRTPKLIMQVKCCYIISDVALSRHGIFANI
jgi:hypothetical protein